MHAFCRLCFVCSPEDLVEFIDFRIAWEQWLSHHHLSKDAADAPNIHGSRVGARTEQDFRSAVPKCDHFVSVGAKRHIEGTSETKVSQLDVARGLDEEILWLEIAMQDAVRVAVGQAVEELVGESLDELRVHGVGIHVALQIHVKELEDKVELGIVVHDIEKSVFVVFFSHTHNPSARSNAKWMHKSQLNTPNNVRVVNLLEERDFADGSGRNTFICFFLCIEER